MLSVFRHDAVTLHSGIKEEDFQKFMLEELMPFFSHRYRGPTRVSVADLKSQTLLKDANGRRKWLWMTTWDGNPDSVRGSSFEHARMIRLEDTEAMIKKLESFGKRPAEKVFSEIASIEAAP